MVFVIDRSSSIREDHFQLIKEFTANITTELINNSSRSAVGVILFSTEADIEFNLQAHTNLSALLSAINGLTQGRGGTNTAEALRLLLSTAEDGQLGLRNGSSRIAIVVTAGQSTAMSAIKKAADKLNSASLFDVYAVGVGNADQTELEIIASSPELVFFTKNFDINGLQQLVDAILTQLCTGK